MSRPGRDYLVEAARQLRLALERDVSEDYEEAFNHYQNGVDVLLRGVQGEGRGRGAVSGGSGRGRRPLTPPSALSGTQPGAARGREAEDHAVPAARRGDLHLPPAAGAGRWQPRRHGEPQAGAAPSSPSG